jgi:hypothetical protein
MFVKLGNDRLQERDFFKVGLSLIYASAPGVVGLFFLSLPIGWWTGAYRRVLGV